MTEGAGPSDPRPTERSFAERKGTFVDHVSSHGFFFFFGSWGRRLASSSRTRVGARVRTCSTSKEAAIRLTRKMTPPIANTEPGTTFEMTTREVGQVNSHIVQSQLGSCSSE